LWEGLVGWDEGWALGVIIQQFFLQSCPNCKVLIEINDAALVPGHLNHSGFGEILIQNFGCFWLFQGFGLAKMEK